MKLHLVFLGGPSECVNKYQHFLFLTLSPLRRTPAYFFCVNICMMHISIQLKPTNISCVNILSFPVLDITFCFCKNNVQIMRVRE